MTPEELQHRTKRFALRVMELYRSLPNDDVARIIGKQVVRSGTSVGANYRSACRAKSSADMANKLKIVEEEADESAYWMELLEEGNICDSTQTKALHAEATEIRKIATASILTLKQGRQNTASSDPQKIINHKSTIKN